MTTPNEELRKQLQQIYKSGELDYRVISDAADLLQSQAERIKTLEAAPQVGYFYKWKDAMHGIAKLMDERDTLRAELAAIAATEPVAEVGGTFTLYWVGSGPIEPIVKKYGIKVGDKLFTRPMPAQDVAELVEALEKLARLGNGEHYGNSDGNMIARDALYKYKAETLNGVIDAARAKGAKQ